MEQEIGFCTASDGVNIAYATLGSGPPLVYVNGWPSHLGLEWEKPFSRALLEALAEGSTLIRYDMRGSGLSDQDISDFSLESLSQDLKAVVHHLDLEQFALLSLGTLAGPIAITYAAAHPQRVTQLILFGGFLRGNQVMPPERQQPFIDYLARFGIPLFEFVDHPDVDITTQRDLRDLIEASAPPAMLAALFRTLFSVDVSDLVDGLSMPILTMHARGDPLIPFALGRELAARLPKAKFVPIEGPSAVAWAQMEVTIPEIRRFLGIEVEPKRKPAPVSAAGRGEAADAGMTQIVSPSETKTFGSGRYVVRRLLGQGAQKSVYLVDDTILGRQCALSVLNAALLDPKDVDRIKREAQTMAQFGAQSNIVTVYDYGEEDGTPFIVCEYVPGGELRDELAAAAGPLPLERALAVAMDICRALSFAHRRDIVHRDLKPENVWLTEERSAKLGDFGIALSLGRTRLTMPGGLTGTSTYMAPEQVSGGDVDARSDLYAFGALLYELVTGRPPFVGDDPNAIMYQHVNTKPESPLDHNASLPLGLERLIMRLLAKPKAERPGSAEEVLTELEQAALELAGGSADVHTILFTDMEGSTTLAGRLGDEKAQEVRRAHNEIVRAALQANSGSEIKHTGDGIMASFSTASSALDCAIAIQQGVASHKEKHPNSPLGVYIGLNAGEPIAEDDDLFGTSVDLAARLVDHAQPGQIIASDVVRQLAAGKNFLFSDLGEAELRGFEDPVKLWELGWREGD